MSKCPKILVIGNNCFSNAGANGRTLANLFIGWPKENVAQFYIKNERPSSSICENYFLVTDADAVRAFLKRRQVGRIIKNEEGNISANNPELTEMATDRKWSRTPFTLLLRNTVWNSDAWRGDLFNRWVDKFQPDLVLLQAGDATFMYRLATNIAHDKQIPLIIYNSEDYYFKKTNYLVDAKKSALLYPFYYSRFKKQFQKSMQAAACCIYNSEMLQATYSVEFKHTSIVLMNSTTMKPAANKNYHQGFVVSYLGNLGVGRHKPLIEIADAIRKIDPAIKLDIYGALPNETVRQALANCPAICYKGLVSYAEVVKIMQDSDLLVHAEDFSAFSQQDLKHAFSTKIADCLASGTCLFVYGPSTIASVQYLMQHHVACVVTDHEQLLPVLDHLIHVAELRKAYVDSALAIARQNHECDKNSQKFYKLISDTVQKVKQACE